MASQIILPLQYSYYGTLRPIMPQFSVRLSELDVGIATKGRMERISHFSQIFLDQLNCEQKGKEKYESDESINLLNFTQFITFSPGMICLDALNSVLTKTEYKGLYTYPRDGAGVALAFDDVL